MKSNTKIIEIFEKGIYGELNDEEWMKVKKIYSENIIVFYEDFYGFCCSFNGKERKNIRIKIIPFYKKISLEQKKFLREYNKMCIYEKCKKEYLERINK